MTISIRKLEDLTAWAVKVYGYSDDEARIIGRLPLLVHDCTTAKED